MADRFEPVGGDASFRLQYVDVSAGAGNKFAPAVALVTSSGVALGGLTNNNAAPAAGSLMGSLMAVASAAVPAWTEGDLVLLSTLLTGLLRTTLGDLIAGENQTLNRLMTLPSYSFTNVVAGTATTTLKSGAGVLRAVTINTKGAASNTLTIYDNTAGSGTKIATIDTTVAATTLYFDAAVGTGITCVSATGTGCDYTVTFI